jgi:hypothetical protein
MSSPPAAPGATSTRKRRRRTWDIGPRYWASLPEDLIRAVAWRVLACGDLLDYVRLRAVCTSWRSGADSPRGRGLADRRFHPRRWMMFPEGHRIYPGRPDLGGCARFIHLDTGALVRARVPLLGDRRPPAASAGSGPGLRRRHPPPPPFHRRRLRASTPRDAPPAPGPAAPRLSSSVQDQAACKSRLRFRFLRRCRSHDRHACTSWGRPCGLCYPSWTSNGLCRAGNMK